MKAYNQTAHKILDFAESKIQLVGFNGFSFKDLQSEIGIKTSSIHYYFPTKQDLVLAILDRYTEQFKLMLKEIEAQPKDPAEQLEAFGDIYIQGVKQNKFCVCGMLASDLLSLSNAAHQKLKCFFIETQNWIEGAILSGQNNGQFKVNLEPRTSAFVFLSMLEGAMLISRTTCDANHLKAAIQQNILQIT